jgi:amyloid beta precursor protein binding protein 1
MTHTLRIDQAFSALADYARSLDLDDMDSTEHSHVPWAVLLVKASLEWKESVSVEERLAGLD